MKKYIIKNCPAFLDDVQLLEFSEGTCNSLQTHRTYCQDCTDCVLKRIVEMCQTYKKVECCQLTEYARREVAMKILDMLEIEECE